MSVPRPSCPFKLCNGSGGTTFRRNLRGELDPNGFYLSTTRCKCSYIDVLQKRWEKTVGSHDQFVRLSTLAPSDKSKLPTSVQEKCIKILKENPGDSYAMFGASGTSKTTYAVALYRHCLDINYDHLDTVVRIKVKTLLDIIHQSKIDDGFDRQNQPPFITANTIRNYSARGIKSHLFLEELEKAKYSEFKATELWDIIDALYEEGGQLVVTGNLHYEDLEDTSKFMEGMARRIEELCPRRWDFWKYTEKSK